MNNNRVTAVLIYMKSLNIVCHVEIIRRFKKIVSCDCYCVNKRRYWMIHQLIVFFSLLCDNNNTEIRDTSCPWGQHSGEVRIGASIHHHHHPHHHHHDHHLTLVSRNDRRLFTPIQSQEASCWWFIVHEVMNFAAHITKCLTGGLWAPCCARTPAQYHCCSRK